MRLCLLRFCYKIDMNSLRSIIAQPCCQVSDVLAFAELVQLPRMALMTSQVLIAYPYRFGHNLK